MTVARREQNRISRERKILEASLTVFSEAGYSGATMDAIAATVGISKPTLYKYFESKEALFAAMMLSKRDAMLLSFEQPSSEGMIRQLLVFAWRYADTVMRPDLLSLARLVIGETHRFPEIGRAYQNAGPDQVLTGMMAWLTAQRKAGRLAFDDAELAAEDLWGLILSAPRTRSLYKPDVDHTRLELARYVNNGLRVFLRAYSVKPADDLEELEMLIEAGNPE